MTASLYTAPPMRGAASGIPPAAASITGTGYRYASVGRRLLALLIDVLFVAVVGVVVFLLSGRSLAFAALCAVQVIAVQWGWEAGRGRTLGKTIMGLRVVRATHDIAESGAGLLPPGAFRALLRTMTTVVTGAVAVVGAFAAECSSAMDGVRHRGLQDVISGTSVIDERIRYVSVDSRDDSVTDRTGTDLTGDDDLDEMVTGGFVLPPSAEAADNSAPAPSIMASRMAAGPSPASSAMAFAAQSATAKPKPVTRVPAAPAGPAEAGTPLPPSAHAPIRPAAPAQSVAAAPATPSPAATPLPSAVRPRQSASLRSNVSPRPPSGVPVPEPSHAAVPPSTVPSPMAQALPPAPALPTSQPASARQVAVVYFENGRGVHLAIPSRAVLGRKPSSDDPGDVLVRVPDTTGTMSRSHALLEIDSGRMWITDLNSTNGIETFGEDGVTRLTPSVRTEIPLGTRVFLGNTAVSVSLLKNREKK
ncbi:RDD family protein [Bifidobacterium bifidum]|uniref:RDD family protein n=1 Tax=Bifidobacterium bifidum TaxID=1681 RepID=UPI0016516EFE|nr:RDD family protein [Bifidobacterium bifidum]